MLGVEPKRCEARHPRWEGYAQRQGSDATEAASDLPPGYYLGRSPGASRQGLAVCDSLSGQVGSGCREPEEDAPDAWSSPANGCWGAFAAQGRAHDSAGLPQQLPPQCLRSVLLLDDLAEEKLTVGNEVGKLSTELNSSKEWWGVYHRGYSGSGAVHQSIGGRFSGGEDLRQFGDGYKGCHEVENRDVVVTVNLVK